MYLRNGIYVKPHEEGSQEEVMVNEETKESDNLVEGVLTKGEENGLEVSNSEFGDDEQPAKKKAVKNKATFPGVNSRKRNLTSPRKRTVAKAGGPPVGTSSLHGERTPLRH
ncbi:hypothetical protein AtNW77_Chr2g0229771 [Arabidopsis thaliana]